MKKERVTIGGILAILFKRRVISSFVIRKKIREDNQGPKYE
ncbi:MAG: hypothetical protein QHH00_04300 [Methanomassiliicoccales archaeon]|nr:hypothetical protein [Methanomassiliicoccales archaeon]